MKKIILGLFLSILAIMIFGMIGFASADDSTCQQDSDCIVFFSNCNCKNICINNSDSKSDCMNTCPIVDVFENLNHSYIYRSINKSVQSCKCENNICVGHSQYFKTLSNGRKAEIKIMPETASATAIKRLGELNFTVELKEIGKGNETKAAYELEGEKQGKMLGLLKVKGKIKIYVDTETGEIIKVKKPWWAFLASWI